MMEIFLDIMPQYYIRTEIRRIIQSTFKYFERCCFKKTVAISKIAIAIVIILDTKMNLIAKTIPQKTHQPMQNSSKNIRKVWHDQNRGK